MNSLLLPGDCQYNAFIENGSLMPANHFGCHCKVPRIVWLVVGGNKAKVDFTYYEVNSALVCSLTFYLRDKV